MRRNQIIFGSILLLVLASFGAVYQFYFREKLEQYNKDRKFREDLEAAAQDISSFFSGTAPETVITRWRNEVQPWAEALQDRASFFDIAGWYEHENPPEQGRILSVWFGEELRKMEDKLYQDIAEKAPNIYPFPENILNSLDVKRQNDEARQAQEITIPFANEQLARLAFGTRFLDLLLEEKILGLNEIAVWPRRQDKNHKGQIVLQTAAADVNIYMRHLVHLLEVLRRQKRYFHVDAIKVSNPIIATESAQQEPYVRAQLLITQGVFSGTADAGAAGSAKSLFEMSTAKTAVKPPVVPVEEPGFMGTAWKWFKRNILYMN